MSTTLSQYANQVTEQKKNEVISQISELYRELVTDISISTIPEKIFVEIFLDYFRSGGQMNTVNPLTIKWLELAGGPYNPVNVLDDKGNIVFTTPGIYCKPNTDTLKVDYGNLVSTFNLKANRIHEEGLNYLTVNLAGTVNKINVEYDSYLLRWKAIFNRYSKAPKQEGKVTVTKIQDNVSDFLDYD